MKFPFFQLARQHAPAAVVLLLCCFLTIAAYISEQRHMRERVALLASADARQFQRTLQQGIDSSIRLNRGVAAYFTASARPGAAWFDAYMRSADVLAQNPGLSYIGYIARVSRAAPDAPAPRPPAAGADPAFAYHYLHAYPDDARSRQAKEFDFSMTPARWSAMQQARDSGESTATAKHAYIAGPNTAPVLLVLTPIYDPALPAATVAQRRIALRGFVFSVYQVEEMIERLMGSDFHALFDLEVYDGAVHTENTLFDGDRRPHVLMNDVDMPAARHATVGVAGREWQLFFFPKQLYLDRFHGGYGHSILAVGSAISAALALLMWSWTRRLSARARRLGDELRFGAMFDNHPSAVYSLDLERRFLNANAEALKEFKVSKANLIGRSIEDFVVPEKQAVARARFADTLLGNSVSYDSAITDGDGARIELSVIMIPIKAGSEVTSVLGIGRNITAQKLTEWKLQESRNMLQLVIDHIPQRVFWKDTHFAFLGCNQAAAQDAGLASAAEIVGRTDYDLAWRASADAYRRDDIDTLASGVAKINFEEQQLRADGSASWLRTSKIPLTDMAGDTVALLCLYEDITERKRLENQLLAMAHYDGLTGVANRAFFLHQLELAVSRSRRLGSPLALMYFDIDHFKSVNDSFGHDCGDALLKAFAQRIGAVLREMDVFARLGGDEFALLLDGLPGAAAAEAVAAKLVDAMQAPFRLGERAVTVSTSIGVAFFQPGMAAGDLVRRADQAMYLAKRGGRNRFHVDRANGPAAL